jgi:hypothetical protein
MKKYAARRGHIDDFLAVVAILFACSISWAIVWGILFPHKPSTNYDSVTVLSVQEHKYAVGDGLTGQRIGTITKIETVVTTKEGKRYIVTGPRFAELNDVVLLDLKGENIAEIGKKAN